MRSSYLNRIGASPIPTDWRELYSDVPDAYRPIIAGRGQIFTIWRPGDYIDACRVFIVDRQRLAALRAPDTYFLVIARRGDFCAIGRPGQ